MAKSRNGRKRWWHFGHPTRGTAGVVFSAMDEMFHGTAKHAQEIREEQRRQAVELFDNEDGRNRVTIDVTKKLPAPPAENNS